MRQIAVVALALLLLATAGATPATAAEAAVTVTVVDQSGDPVPDATVTATWDGGSDEGDTKSNGQVILDVEEGADVNFTVSHDTFVRNAPYQLANASAGDVEIDVHERGRVRVQVSDADGSLAGTTVVATKNGVVAATGETGPDGEFLSDPVETGTYDVSVHHPGYYNETNTTLVYGTVSREFTLETGQVDLTLSVVDDHFDPPVAIKGATVEFPDLGATVSTFADGEASTDVPVNSRHEFEVRKSEYETVSREVRVGESAGSVTVTMNLAPLLNVTPTSDRVVAGERTWVDVTDEYGEPAAGVDVLLDGSVVGTTDEDGRYRLLVETADEHELQARNGSITSEPVIVEAFEGEPSTTTATAAPATTSPGQTSHATTQVSTSATASTTSAATQSVTTDATTTAAPTTASDGIPGFGLAAALLGVGLAVLLGRRG